MPIVSGGTGGGGGAMALISATTLAADGIFDLQNLSQSYNALRIVGSFRGTRAAQPVEVLAARLNNDSGANYDYAYFAWQGGTTGTGVSAQTAIGFAFVPAATATANQFGTAVLDIALYTSATLFKGCSGYGSQGIQTAAGGGVWKSTAAVTRVQIFGLLTTNLLAGSQLYCYGIT